MGRMTPVEVPSEFVGGSQAAVAAAGQVARREWQRAAERKCADNVNGAWAWIDTRPVLLADDGLAVWAARAITLKRIPLGLTSLELERWLVDGFESRQVAA